MIQVKRLGAAAFSTPDLERQIAAGIFATLDKSKLPNLKNMDPAGMAAVAVLSGAGILQYANVRASYSAETSGRAMSVFTMAMFLGVAVVQSLSGLAASWSQSLGQDPYAGVLVCVASPTDRKPPTESPGSSVRL